MATARTRNEAREREEAALMELMTMTNWGRWGANDELGALNLVTPAAVRRGASCVRTGRVYGLGSLVGDPATPRPGGPVPQLFMNKDGGDWRSDAEDAVQYSSDTLLIQVHGVTSHVDGLCHTFRENCMYNGFSKSEVTSEGARRLGIDKLPGISTRGLLFDVAALRGQPRLDSYDLVTAEDLEQIAASSGIEPQPGDAVLVRTGWPNAYAESPRLYGGVQPGLGPSAALFLARHDVCLIGADNPGLQGKFEHVLEANDWRHGLVRLHVPIIRNLGIYIVEMLDLEHLAADRVVEFNFCLAPLRIKGGTGSPVNPLAIA